MKINNPNKLSSRKKLENIMNTPNHGEVGIFMEVLKHNERFNDNLGYYITYNFKPPTPIKHIDMKVNNPKQSSRNYIIREFYNRGEIWGYEIHLKLKKHNLLHDDKMDIVPYPKVHFIYE